jgi:spermidine dehydrogenase
MNSDDNRDPLGLGVPIERRDMLGGMLAGAALALSGCGQATGPSSPSVAEPQNEPGYYPPQRMGLRGSHPGSFENAHALRDGTLKPEHAESTGESYDLVVVGGGISGLSAAYVMHTVNPNARILVLDNHDDFGGHAKRNEFVVDGHTLLINGGTMLIDSPRPYGPVPAGLLKDLGIDPKALAEKYPRKPFDDLGSAVFFDKATFGADRLVKFPSMKDRSRATLAAALAQSPLPQKAQEDIARVEFDATDYLPGLSEIEKRQRLSKMSYRDFLAKVIKVHPAAADFYQTRTHGEWGIGIDGEPALDCWGIGLPGFDGLGLDRSKIDYMGNTAAGYSSTGGSDSFHFPDGNATIARAIVRKLVPAVAPAGDIEGLVSANFDYSQLDKPGQPVRIRLNSVVVHASSDPARPIEVAYMSGGKLRRVIGKGCVLAGYNMMIPYIVPDLPEAQKEALHQLVKVPLVYTAVAVRNWQPFHKLGLQRITCPGSYFSSVSLSAGEKIGSYASGQSPDEPALIFLVRTPCSPGAPTERDQHRAGRMELLATPFETFETNTRAQLNQILGPGGFDAKRDIAAIAVNRWPHGYAYEYNPLYDPWNVPTEDRPHMQGRKRFGRIAIANSDSGAAAYTDCAIEQGHRAVSELIAAKVLA